MSTRHTVKFL